MTDMTPDQQKQKDFADKVSALQKTYLEGLNDKEREIRRHLEKFWETIDWPREDIVELHRLCHNLAGSAKVFDREQISLVAKDASIHLQNLLDGKEILNSEFKATIYEIINALRKQIALGATQVKSATVDVSRFEEPPAVLANPSVILVDDDVQQASMLTLEMQKSGYEVVLFHSLSEFSEYRWPEVSPAAIVMDMVFPEGEDAGAETLKDVLSKAGVNVHIPVIFMSVRDDMSARLSALRAGADRYLLKPFGSAKLVSMLDGMTHRVPADPYRILLIDDEETLANYYGAMLREAGLNTCVLTNPMSVLAYVESFNPDVIVTDVYMPQCKGTELSVIIREKESLAQIPIIYLSAEKDIEKQIAALDMGADEFLSKPVDAMHLITIVRGRARRFRHLQRIHHELEDALREIKSQKIALDEHAVVSIADAEGNIEYANDKFCKISGYSRVELLGRNHRLLKSGVHEEEFYKNLWRTIASGKVWQGEICNRRRDGGLYWVESTIVPLLGENGTPVRYISVRTDISALKRSQKTIKESEERFRRSQYFANIGTWDWNIETGELFWSERIAHLFGYQDSLLENTFKSFLSVVYPDDRDSVSEAVRACIEDGAEFNMVHRVIWQDGSIHWLREQGNVVRDSTGKPLHMLGAVQDITTQRDYEQALTLARMEAEKANKAKSEFLSSMSHELRTPLNAILGFGQLLEADTRDPLSEGQKESIQEILKAGLHLLELINDVLDLARIEGGGLSLTIAPVQLLELVRSSVQLVMPMAQKRRVNILIDQDSCAEHVVLADATRLRQILLNFMSNAVKYNRIDGEVKIYCEFNMHGKLRINIEDTGNGIEADKFTELFTSFSRLGAERTDVEGTGIGLVITKHMVERMNGRVGVKSTFGEGSTFWFELPYVTAKEPDLQFSKNIDS